MVYAGTRDTLPSSLWSGYLDVIEATGWTWQELRRQPATLVMELQVRLQKRAKAQKKAAKNG